MLLALPDPVTTAIARYLPLSSAVAVACTCRRLRLTFPQELGEACATPIRICARVTHKPQLACLLEWMRVYDLTLVVRGKDIARIVNALAGLAGPARWARLELGELGNYTAVYRHMRRWGLIERITRKPKPLYYLGATRPNIHNIDEWDWQDAEEDRSCWLKAHSRMMRSVSDALVPHLSGLHTLDLSCGGATDAGVAHLSGLHTLILRSNTGVTDTGVRHLSRLHTLDLGHTPVTDAGLEYLSGLHTLLL